MSSANKFRNQLRTLLSGPPELWWQSAYQNLIFDVKVSAIRLLFWKKDKVGRAALNLLLQQKADDTSERWLKIYKLFSDNPEQVFTVVRPVKKKNHQMLFVLVPMGFYSVGFHTIIAEKTVENQPSNQQSYA